MTLAVSAIGVFIAAVGGTGVLAPTRLVEWIRSIWRKDRLWLSAALRLLIGAWLIVAAPACRAAELVRVLGILTVLAAAGLVLVGAERVDRFVRWWCELPALWIRAWSLSGVALGGFLLYAGS